ncbi:MAG: divergent polysaccharide deacetylase family protein [Rhodospirillales bacterium]
MIDDVGLNRARTKEIIALDAPLTLSFLTYAGHLPEQTRAARARGHETMLHVAMEPMGRDADPGPGALLTSHSEAEILRRLRAGLGRFEGIAGVNNHMGSRFTAERASLMTVMAELGARGLFFLDSRTSARSVAAGVASEFGVPFAVRDVFLDDAADSKTTAQRLAETEALARRQGHAVAIGHPRDATLAALRAWIPQARARGVVIAPVSAVIRRLEDERGW